MIEFHGRLIPTTLEELVDPRYTALLVVDVQNDFCVKGGIIQKLGRSLSKGDAIIKRLKLLMEEAKKVGVKTVYLQHTTFPGHRSSSAAWLRQQMKVNRVDDPNLISELTLEGSWGQQIVEDVKPRDGDLVVKKNRNSGFIGTNLDMLLRTNGIKTLLVTGVVTQACVLSTAWDALHNDYFVVTLRDCVDSTKEDLHEAALKILEERSDVVASDQIIEIWKKKSYK